MNEPTTIQKRMRAVEAKVALDHWYQGGTLPRLLPDEREAVEAALKILNEYGVTGL